MRPQGAIPATRILVAEDQAVVRRGIAMLLSITPDMECVGQARDGEEAVTLAALLRPDVILMDLHMPKKSGASAIRDIKRTQPGLQILVLTTLDDEEAVFHAVCGGACGYLLKDASEDELLETIRELRRGESRVTAPIASRLTDQLVTLARRRAADAQASIAELHSTSATAVTAAVPLTERESELLALVTSGANNREIAFEVALPEDVIKRHLCQILTKFHAMARLEFPPRPRGEGE